jgi:NhaP-type Na+/H+ or K+/H+ antiporter
MELAALCLTLVGIVLWAGISTRAAVISTPIFFVAVGLMLAEGLHLFDLETDSHQVKIIAEVTLVWVLFADASRIRMSDLRADLGRCIRLLGLGLPLTIAFGAVAGYMLLGISPWYALLLGAALAPTDAALGSAVMSDQRVPQPVRRVLNVQSGLNDEIATPVVMVALAGIAIWYAHIEVEALFEQMAAKSLVARSVTRLSLQDQRTRGSSH